MRRTIRVLVCLCASVALLMGASAVSARKPPPHGDIAPLGAVADVLVDPAHKKVFVASGPDAATPRIAVAGLNGDVKGWFNGLPAATDLTIDGDTLYALMPGVPAVGVIDIPSLEEADEIELRVEPVSHAPTLVFANDRLWYVTCRNDPVEIVSLDPATGLSLQYPIRDVGCPKLFAAQDNPDTIVALEYPGAIPMLSIIDVSTPVPVVARQQRLSEGPRDFEIAPDGSSVYATRGSRVEEYSIEDFSLLAQYSVAGTTPFAIDVSESGNRVAVAGSTYDDWQVDVFERGGGDPIDEYRFPHGEEWSEFALHPDESTRRQELYLLSVMSYRNGPLNLVVTGPTKMEVKFNRAYSRRGGRYKFHRGVSPVLVTRVRPVHRRVPVTLHVAYRYGRYTWAEIGQQDFKLDDTGRLAVRFPASLFRFRPGDVYRVYVEFHGDGAHPPAYSGQKYMTFTR
jgi:hypothetical protein